MTSVGNTSTGGHGGRRTARSTAALALALGVFSSTSQIILLREVLNFGRGNELTVASALFFWLAGIGLGAWGLAALRWKRGVGSWLTAALWAVLAVSFLSLAASRTFGFLTAAPVGESVSLGDLLLCCALSMLPPGFLMGASFPMLVRAGGGSLTGSTVYLLEAAGSALGGLAFTFLLAGRASHFTALALAALPLLAAQAAWGVGVYSSRKSRLLSWPAACLAALALAALAGPLDRGTHRLRWQSISGALRLVDTKETRHQRLDMAVDEEQVSLFSDGSFDFAFPDPYGTGRLADLVLLEHPRPRRVLAVGPGPIDSAARAEVMGVTSFDYVQIDPVVMDLVKSVKPNQVERLFCSACTGRFVHDDGRRFIRLAPAASYDVVWVDLGDPMTLLLNRYYTLDFYREVERALKPDGVFVTGFNLDYNAPQSESREYSSSIYMTLAEVFRSTLLGFFGKVIVFASGGDRVITDDPALLSSRAAGRGLDAARHPPELYENFFDETKSRWLLGLLEKETAVINTDMHPVSYRLQLQYFMHLTGSSIESDRPGAGETLLRQTWRIPWAAGLIPGLLVLVVLLGARRRAWAAPASIVYAMALTGASGILLQLVLLLAYQTFSGVLYEGIGLLYAAFMAGLMAGTAAGSRAHRLRAPVSEVVVTGNIAAVILLLPAASTLVALIPILVLTSGFATGFAFPLLYAAHRRGRESRREEGLVTSAGIIDGADHVGAALGALLCALVLIPSFGLLSTLVLLMAWKATSLAGLLIAGNR